jgi:putative transcriptional regulator
MLLSPIARFLKTDVNNLIEFHENITDHEVLAYYEIVCETFENKGIDSGILKAKELVQKYPNNNYLKLKLSIAIRYYSDIDNLKLCEEWLLQVYNRPNEKDSPSVKAGSLSTLCMLYKDSGQLHKIEELIEAPEDIFDTTLMLSQVYLMQGKLAEAEALFKQKAFGHFYSMIAGIKGLYDVSIEKKDYLLAEQYADDYYSLTSKIQIQYAVPSELLLFLSLAKGEMNEALDILRRIVFEIKSLSGEVLPKRYIKLVGDEPKIFSTSKELKTNEMFLLSLRENVYAKEFLELSDVNALIKEIEEIR